MTAARTCPVCGNIVPAVIGWTRCECGEWIGEEDES